MIRRITLSLALLAAACGEESDDKPRRDAGADAGARADAGSSDGGGGGTEAPVTPDIVTNVGEACRSANACSGERPSCQTMLSLLGQSIPFPAGYCSAPCADNRECGEEGECPIGESLKAIPATFRGLIGGAAPSHCYQRCESARECRTGEGYRCTTILGAINEAAGGALEFGGFDVGLILGGQIADSKYCLPPAPELPDAGPGPSDAGMDAGQDAGSDAGRDAGQDAGQDAGGGADQDAGFDAGQDAGTDAGQDAGTDAGADLDAGSDAGQDAESSDSGNEDASGSDASNDV